MLARIVEPRIVGPAPSDPTLQGLLERCRGDVTGLLSAVQQLFLAGEACLSSKMVARMTMIMGLTMGWGSVWR